MVESQTELGTARAEQGIGQDEVGNQVAGGVVGSLGPFGGTEAESSENGSVEPSASHSSICLYAIMPVSECNLRHYSRMRIRDSSDVGTCTGRGLGDAGVKCKRRGPLLTRLIDSRNPGSYAKGQPATPGSYSSNRLSKSRVLHG